MPQRGLGADVYSPPPRAPPLPKKQGLLACEDPFPRAKGHAFPLTNVNGHRRARNSSGECHKEAWEPMSTHPPPRAPPLPKKQGLLACEDPFPRAKGHAFRVPNLNKHRRARNSSGKCHREAWEPMSTQPLPGAPPLPKKQPWMPTWPCWPRARTLLKRKNPK
jgi:hypothetical protein